MSHVNRVPPPQLPPPQPAYSAQQQTQINNLLRLYFNKLDNLLQQLIDGSVDSITFEQAAGISVTPGQMAWNAADGTLDIGMGYDGVVQQVGLETYYRIKADGDINNGDVVMYTGSVGASGVIKAAPSATVLTEGLVIMGVATMDIPNNAFGYITAFGLVRGINTTGASVGETWVDGDILYYNPNYVGSLTNVRPLAPNEVVVVAAVVNAAPGGSGELLIRVNHYPNLFELSDVYSVNALAGDILIYSGTRWESTPTTAITASVPVTKVADFSVADTDKWIINNKSGSTCTATLPSAATYAGRELHFQNYQAQLLVSASSNVVPLVGGAAGTSILTNVAGDTRTLVSDGSNWLITQ